LKTSQKHNALISLAFAAYSALTLAIFNPFVFLNAPRILICILLVCFGSFVATFATLILTQKWKNQAWKKVLFILSFLIGAAFASLTPWVIYRPEAGSFLLYLSSFVIVALLPMSIATLWLIFDELKNRISISSETKEEVQLIKLISDKGKILAELDPKKVICFEANDNYVIVYFLNDNNDLVKLMERISLKRINSIADELNISFKRVHKSYLINPEFVQKVAGKAQAHRIHMEHIEEPVPVSRNFDIREIQE
jgi:hypothetical protein